MNLNFLCCVGAELKNSTTQTTRMPQIYFYRAFEDETIENMLSPGFFDTALGLIRKDDLLLLYDPKNDSVRWVYARVTETDRDGVVVEKMSINGVDVSVDTTGFSELDADNLQTLAEQINSRLSELRGKITQETQDRKDAVQAEADARKAADIVLQNNIDTVSGNLSTHINDKDNPHTVTKAQVGLGNVDNTSDADKPVSDATQTELDKKQDTLVSGTNIKTVNGETLLGSGNIKIESGSGGGVPVGAIFTTPRTGTIPGAVEANGGSYNIADYSGEGSIGALLTAGSIAYVSKTEFQTQVANTGACDSFGWNGTSDATFLVPKLNPWHIGKSAPVVGTGVALGLTPYGFSGAGSAAEPKMSATAGFALEGSTGSYRQGVGISQNKNESGMIADLSETTNLRVMVQLATGATDQALETCTSVLADVSALKYDYVVDFQAPTAANGYTWYRKYKSGWVEQGGISDGDYNTIITLPVIMADNNYYINAYCFYGASGVATVTVASLNDADITTTTIRLQRRLNGGGSNGQVRWQVSGMAA